MTARSTCLSPRCGARVLDRRLQCPDCGRPMFSDREVGRRGWHILPLGCILVVAMVFATWALDLLPAVAQSEDTTYSGTATMAWVLLGGFASIAMMGIAVVVAAAQMILGLSSRAAAIAMILLFVLGLALIGVAVVDAGSTVMAASER